MFSFIHLLIFSRRKSLCLVFPCMYLEYHALKQVLILVNILFLTRRGRRDLRTKERQESHTHVSFKLYQKVQKRQ